MCGAVTVDNWGQALAMVRGLEYGEDVKVPKPNEPTLPRTVSLRRSNFPYSMHKGAVNVYREDKPGGHLQIREYPKYWSVQRDRFNPHYQPVSHARTDIPAMAFVGLPIFGLARGMLMAGEFTAVAADISATVVSDSIVGALDILLP